MADTYRLRCHGTRVGLVLAGVLLGLSFASPAGADPVGTGSDTEHPLDAAGVPSGVTDGPGPAASSTSSTSTTSSSTSTTTTTSVPLPPATSVIVPPLVDSTDPPEIGAAAEETQAPARTIRAQSTARGQTVSSAGPELPFTGNSSLGVIGSGFAALGMGALALWWGSRKRPGVDAVDASGPPA